MIDKQQGAALIIELAKTDKGYDYNGYYFKRQKPAKAAPVAYNKENWEKLWELSEDYLKAKVS
jgi:hypothetical protein